MNSSLNSSQKLALEQVKDIVGEKGIVVDPIQQGSLLTDERGLYLGKAALIVRPALTDELSRIMRICYEAGIGMVPQGGNTGYCGGATPDESGTQILINMSRMHAIRNIDPIAFTMTVEAGAILADIHDAAAKHGLLFPLSMGSEGSCQIGGNLSTNAGGVAVVRYGNACDLVLGLEVVLGNGDVIDELKGLRKDNTGYDLKSLFIGAEGTLGIITAAVLKLFPMHRDIRTALLAVNSIESACRLLATARKESGEHVTSFEYFSSSSLVLVLNNIPDTSSPFDVQHEHYILMELSSAAADGALATVVEKILESGMESGDILDGVIARSEQQRQQLWRLRESIPEAENHEGGAIKHDVSIAISRIPEFMRRTPEVALAVVPGSRLSSYGHIGDGNIHFNLLPPAECKDTGFKLRHSEAVSKVVYDLVAEMHGSFSAEHGIGKLKRDALQTYKEDTSLDLMKRCKELFDPKGLMNPGKVIS